MPESIDNSIILNYCKNIFGGIWNEKSENDVSIQQLSGGFSSSIHLVKINNAIKTKPTDVTKVLVRLYGKSSKSNFQSIIQDTALNAILSEKGIMPKLFAVFPEGRLEKYIEDSRNMTMSEFRQDSNSEKIARQLYRIHQLEMPLSRRPEAFFKVLENIMKEITSSYSAYKAGDEETVKLVEKSFRNRAIAMFDFIRENEIENKISEFKKLLFQDLKEEHTIVFCHNDLYTGNILVVNEGKADSKQTRLQLIDFEFSCYGLRGSDIAMYFCERTFTECDEWPGFIHEPDQFPTEHQQISFLRAYFSQSGTPNITECPSELNKLKKEIHIGMCFTYLCVSLYCFRMCLTSNMESGTLEGGILRYELFLKALNDFKLKYKLE